MSKYILCKESLLLYLLKIKDNSEIIKPCLRIRVSGRKKPVYPVIRKIDNFVKPIGFICRQKDYYQDAIERIRKGVSRELSVIVQETKYDIIKDYIISKFYNNLDDYLTVLDFENAVKMSDDGTHVLISEFVRNGNATIVFDKIFKELIDKYNAEDATDEIKNGIKDIYTIIKIKLRNGFLYDTLIKLEKVLKDYPEIKDADTLMKKVYFEECISYDSVQLFDGLFNDKRYIFEFENDDAAKLYIEVMRNDIINNINKEDEEEW